MTLFWEAAAAAGERGAGGAGRGGPPSACVLPAAAASLAQARPQPQRSHLPARLPRRPPSIRVYGRAEVQRSGCSGPPGWGVSSPGEGLPPRGRRAGGRVRTAPSPAPRRWLSPRGGLPGAACRTTRLRPAAGSLAARVRSGYTRSAGSGSAGGERSTSRAAARVRGGAWRKDAPRPSAGLALRAEPSSSPSTSRGTLTTSRRPRLHVPRTSALSPPGVPPGVRRAPLGENTPSSTGHESRVGVRRH